jgi:hypothetical protein
MVRNTQLSIFYCETVTMSTTSSIYNREETNNSPHLTKSWADSFGDGTMRRDEVQRKGAGRAKVEEYKEDQEDQERRERKEDKTRDKKEQIVKNPGKPVEHELYPTHNELSSVQHDS